MSSFWPSQVAPDICHNHLISTSAEVPVIVYQACDSTTLMRLGRDTASGKGHCKETAILLVTSTHSGRVTTWVSLLTTGFKTPLKQTNAKVITIWPSRGGNLGVILVGCGSQYFKTYPIHIPGLWKNGHIHIHDHPKCWPIHILPFDFVPIFFCWLLDKYHSQLWNTKRIRSLEKSLSETYVHIPGCKKNGAFHIGIQKNRVIHILFVEKRGPIIYLAALKKGAIRHAHPNYAIYRKLPAPPSTPSPPPAPEMTVLPAVFESFYHINTTPRGAVVSVALGCSGLWSAVVQWKAERCGAVVKRQIQDRELAGSTPVRKNPVRTKCWHFVHIVSTGFYSATDLRVIHRKWGGRIYIGIILKQSSLVYLFRHELFMGRGQNICAILP